MRLVAEIKNDSSGIYTRIARKTDSPPTPESKIPMGEVVEGMGKCNW